MAELHIEEFSRDCAVILLELYARFPRPALLEVADICGPDTPDDYGVHSQRHQACFGTIVWLAEEGWLRFGEAIRQEGFDQVVLTARAYQRLVRPLSAPDELLTEAARLAQLLHTGSSTALHLHITGLLFAADRP